MAFFTQRVGTMFLLIKTPLRYRKMACFCFPELRVCSKRPYPLVLFFPRPRLSPRCSLPLYFPLHGLRVCWLDIVPTRNTAICICTDGNQP
jgi:hypothetical protein